MDPKIISMIAELAEASPPEDELRTWSAIFSAMGGSEPSPRPAAKTGQAPNTAKAPAPGPVNAALCAKPDLFPLSVGWADLFHDKGQLSRASPEWISEFWAKRPSQGERPEELGAWCWTMALAGQNMAPKHFQALLAAQPEAARCCVDEEATKAAFSKIASAFEAAALDWEPPKDMAMRGWGRNRFDAAIQQDSRARFAALAPLCRELAATGLPRALRALALGDGMGDEPADFDSQSWLGARRHASLAFLLGAKAAGVGAAELWDGAAGSRFMATACLAHAPKNFRLAIASMADDPVSRSAAAGAAAALAMERVAAEVEGLAPASSKAAGPSEAGGALARHQAGLRGRRAADALGYFANWSLAAEDAGPEGAGALDAFMEAAVGAPLRSEGFQRAADKLLALCEAAPPLNPLSLFCCALAQAMERAGAAPAFSERAKASAWRAHLAGAALGAEAHGAQAKGYATRHLRLSAHYPLPDCEAESLRRANSATAAYVEEAELAKLVPLLMADPGAVDSDDPGAAGGARAVERPSKKVRL